MSCRKYHLKHHWCHAKCRMSGKTKITFSFLQNKEKVSIAVVSFPQHYEGEAL